MLPSKVLPVAIATSPIRGAWNRQNQWTVPSPGGKISHSSYEKFGTLVEIEVGTGIKCATSVLSSQSDHSMLKYVEGEALPRVSLKVPVEEVVPPLEELPGVVQLDPSQLGKLVAPIPGIEGEAYSSCCKDGDHANDTSSGMGDSESGRKHGVGRKEGASWCGILFRFSSIRLIKKACEAGKRYPTSGEF